MKNTSVSARSMSRQTFFHNVMAGVMAIGIAFTATSFILHPPHLGDPPPAAEYEHAQDVRRHEQWLQQRQSWITSHRPASDVVDRFHFERAIAGLENPWALRDWRARPVANALRTLNPASGATPEQRAQTIHELVEFSTRSMMGRLVGNSDYNSCSYGDVQYDHPCPWQKSMTILERPYDLVALWQGHAPAAPEDFMASMPQNLRNEPAIRPATRGQSTRVFTSPSFGEVMQELPWFAWFALAELSFAAGYILWGWRAVRKDEHKPEHERAGDPLHHLPTFVVGLIILLLASPGLLLAKGVQLLMTDWREVHAAKQREVVSLLEQLRQRLMTRRQNAEAQHDTDAVQHADALLQRVNELQGVEDRVGVRLEMENIQFTLDGIDDANRIVGQRGSSS